MMAPNRSRVSLVELSICGQRKEAVASHLIGICNQLWDAEMDLANADLRAMDAELARTRAAASYACMREVGTSEQAKDCYDAFAEAILAELDAIAAFGAACRSYSELALQATVAQKDFDDAQYDIEVALYDVLLAEEDISEPIAAD